MERAVSAHGLLRLDCPGRQSEERSLDLGGRKAVSFEVVVSSGLCSGVLVAGMVVGAAVTSAGAEIEPARRIARAVAWTEAARDARNGEDAYRKGFELERRSTGGTPAEAAWWYRKGALLGSAAAQNALGRMYLEGIGVRPDAVEARRWIEAAAQQGYAPAEANLGAIYAAGWGGETSDEMAARWMRRAAEHGDPSGQHNLAVLHLLGRGVPQDDAEAVRWLQMAARSGHAEALYGLGALYEVGRGVPKSAERAAAHYVAAARLGHEKAQTRLRQVGISWEAPAD